MALKKKVILMSELDFNIQSNADRIGDLQIAIQTNVMHKETLSIEWVEEYNRRLFKESELLTLKEEQKLG